MTRSLLGGLVGIGVGIAGAYAVAQLAQGLPAVTIERAPEHLAPDPRSGKYRRVWSELHR